MLSVSLRALNHSSPTVATVTVSASLRALNHSSSTSAMCVAISRFISGSPLVSIGRTRRVSGSMKAPTE